jgi:hypothetical protein
MPPQRRSQLAGQRGSRGRVRAGHKLIADLAVMLALGGDCLADIAMLRTQPQLFGPVASDLVVSRLVARLAAADIGRLDAITPG